jgi:molybdopterin-guanine dinucleotide biosynthesis protein A
VETSVIVLAGGASRRLGHDKLGERVGGDSLLADVVEKVAPLGDEVVVVTKSGDASLPLPPSADVRVVGDLLPGKGPLVGIYTGLKASRFPRSLVVAADMPFLSQDLLRHMIALAVGVDAVTPRVGGMVEPLHSVYGNACLTPIEEMLDRGELSVYSLFPRIRVRYVETDEIARYDPERLSFFNINTPEDLERARELSGRQAGHD